MSYFNYHAKAKKMIKEGKLVGFYFVDSYNNISPCMVLLFNDLTHPVMPIRAERWGEYTYILPKEKFIDKE
ncbi:MAG: thermostable hemolysin delta-VPH [Clostridia bacterium]|nr:thermostable hemolysin delta-VPH [Clostridia bacterium]